MSIKESIRVSLLSLSKLWFQFLIFNVIIMMVVLLEVYFNKFHLFVRVGLLIRINQLLGYDY